MSTALDVNDLKEAFFNFDYDKDGYLTTDELRHILTNIGDPMTMTEVEEFIAEADPNRTGKVDYHQFAELIMSA